MRHGEQMTDYNWIPIRAQPDLVRSVAMTEVRQVCQVSNHEGILARVERGEVVGNRGYPKGHPRAGSQGHGKRVAPVQAGRLQERIADDRVRSGRGDTLQ